MYTILQAKPIHIVNNCSREVAKLTVSEGLQSFKVDFKADRSKEEGLALVYYDVDHVHL